MNQTTGSRKFGTFRGVFIPTFLSIVGVILFLRLGYIVGGAGLYGTIAIILLAVSVSFSTGLSLSSIASNIRIGAGGAYSIINKTLGLEIGGSIGVPLYLAQTFSVALYIFGFAEAWQFIFPAHNIKVIALIAFLILFILTFVSTKLAVKIQVGVFGLICLSLLIIFIGGFFPTPELSVAQNFPDPDFWKLFAIFFPAVTGLMAGIGMSGELSDPKRQISKGILYGLGSTTVIYIGMAILLASSTSSKELLSTPLVLAQISIAPALVIGGILAATLSSALTMMIAAPRVLEALGENSVLPGSNFLSNKEEQSEPRNAILLTGLLVLPLLFLGGLNSVAQVLTMFFLITYIVINVAVFLEQSLGLRSFRPTFKVSRFIPLYGAVGSLVMMNLVNPYASMVAIVFIGVVYFLLTKRSLEGQPKEGDVRSGIFRTLSQWAAQKARSFPESQLHIWKPNMIVPVTDTNKLASNFPLIKSIVHPQGNMTVLGFNLTDKIKEIPGKDTTRDQLKKELDELPKLVKKFNEEDIFTSHSTINAEDYMSSLIVSMEAIQSQIFSPNVLFLPYKPDQFKKDKMKKLIKVSKEKRCGIALFDKQEDFGLGAQEDIHVWITSKVLDHDMFKKRHYDLALLMAYSIKKNWDGKIHIWMCTDEKEKAHAQSYLHKLTYEARLPHSTEVKVKTGDFFETLKNAPKGDLHIFPFEEGDLDSAYKIAKTPGKSNLFVLDSTRESILA